MNNDLLYRLLSTIFILPLCLFLIILGGNIFIFFLIICMFLTIIEWHNMTKNMLIKLCGFLFIIFAFYSTYQIRFDSNNEQGLIFFLIILFTCIFTDLGGYIFGKVFKGPKLTKISPNKTYSGVFGSFFCSILFIHIILFYIKHFYNLNFTFDLKFFSYIFFISFISQAGDLVVSYFKRLSNIKDTGKLIPGHGGILDRIDGMIFTFPVVFILDFYLK